MKAYDFLSTFPDVNPALKRFETNSDIECVVFSNGTKTMVSDSVNGSEDLESSVFKDLITVDSVRAFKPAPEVYKFLVQKVDRVGQEDKIWLASSSEYSLKPVSFEPAPTWTPLCLGPGFGG